MKSALRILSAALLLLALIAATCPNRAVAAPARLDLAACRQFVLEVGVVDRRGHQAVDAEGGFHREHRDEELPGLGVDPRADDLRVEEILELVDHHEESERAERDRR